MKTTPLKLMAEATRMACEDFKNGVPERHKTNSGKALAERCLVPTQFNGDARYLRQAYSAAYWFASMQAKREPRKQIECPTCLGHGCIEDGETQQLRTCLDCNGTGKQYK